MNPPQRRNIGFAVWCGGAVLLGAFLLFQVQPMISRMILPWFGGGPAVWTACLLFFQLVLLAGYGYAYALCQFLPVKLQATVHWLLLAAALFMLPVTPAESWQPADGSLPVLRILLLLTAHIGLPYLLLAATAPLIQSWWSQVYNPQMPYRLYALSNAGSLIALLSYPVLVEPSLSTPWQGLLWSVAFCGFALLCGSLTVMLWLHRPDQTKQTKPGESADETGDAKIAWRSLAAWCALSAAGVITLMAVTNHLSQDIAVTPLLWVAPLSLYLISFILCFDRPSWSQPRHWAPPAAISICMTICYSTLNLGRLVRLLGRAGYLVSPALESLFDQHLQIEAFLWLTSLFLICMLWHGMLVQQRPPRQFHTLFYLTIAAGGALGGMTVAVICPAVFPVMVEPRLCMAGGLMLSSVFFIRDLSPAGSSWLEVLAARRASVWQRLVRFIVSTGAVALLVIVLYPLMLSLVFPFFDANRGDQPWRGRNFYGALEVHEVKAEEPRDSGVSLFHGTTLHGFQFSDPSRRLEPTTYFARNSGAGLALENFPRFEEKPAAAPIRPRQLRVGVIGLGAGTLAAYGRRGDHYTFYEIDQMVIDIAKRHFTFLKDSAADIDIQQGDARISLKHQPPQNFDVFILDAFSGDAIPVHLLTLEAMVLYQQHLTEDGVMAFHISNRHLDLEPVVRALAARLNYPLLRISTEGNDPAHITGSDWLLLSRNEAFMQSIEAHASPVSEAEPLLWTDDFSNLLKILK